MRFKAWLLRVTVELRVVWGPPAEGGSCALFCIKSKTLLPLSDRLSSQSPSRRSPTVEDGATDDRNRPVIEVLPATIDVLCTSEGDLDRVEGNEADNPPPLRLPLPEGREEEEEEEACRCCCCAVMLSCCRGEVGGRRTDDEDGRVAVADTVVAVVVVVRRVAVVRLRSRVEIPPGVPEGEVEGENPTKRPRGDAAVGEVDVMVGGIDE